MISEVVRVAVLEENSLVRECLGLFLNARDNLSCNAQVDAAGLVGSHDCMRADVILLDHTACQGRAPSLVRLLGVVAPQARVLAFDAWMSMWDLDELINAGGWGFVSKEWGPRELVEAIHEVHQGGVVGMHACGRAMARA